MPRPPARRARTAANKASTNVAGKETGVSKDGSVTTPRQAADLQSAQAAPAHDGGHRTDLTPTKDSHETAIASSPAGNTTTASVRPPTRARGYSSTLSLVGRKGDFNSRVGSTPGFESSILSNFKKRSRQPSLLQMIQADDDEDSSDYDDDDFLGGFSPQDESTPLNVARKSIIAERELIASPSRAGPAHISPPSSTEPRKRKRQSVDVADEQQEQQDAHRVVSPALRSRSSSLSTLTPAPESPAEFPAASQQNLLSPSSTLATPMSTSDSTAATPSRLMAGQHMATTSNSVAPIETLPKVTTLSIQTRFLPQRRIRRRQRMASEEVDSNNSADEDPDEDELTREVMRRPQQVRRQGLSNATSEKTNAKPTKNTSRRGAQKKSSKASATIHETVESRGSRSRRTYSRQAQAQAQAQVQVEALDKENHEIVDSSDLSSPPPSEDLEDSDLEMTSRPRGSKTRISSRELQDAARKFAEVDKWEMDFEDVSHSESSPMR